MQCNSNNNIPINVLIKYEKFMRVESLKCIDSMKNDSYCLFLLN